MKNIEMIQENGMCPYFGDVYIKGINGLNYKLELEDIYKICSFEIKNIERAIYEALELNYVTRNEYDDPTLFGIQESLIPKIFKKTAD